MQRPRSTTAGSAPHDGTQADWRLPDCGCHAQPSPRAIGPGAAADLRLVAPDAKLTGLDLKDVPLSSIPGKRVLNIFPSLDTAVCAMSVRDWDGDPAIAIELMAEQIEHFAALGDPDSKS